MRCSSNPPLAPAPGCGDLGVPAWAPLGASRSLAGSRARESADLPLDGSPDSGKAPAHSPSQLRADGPSVRRLRGVRGDPGPARPGGTAHLRPAEGRGAGGARDPRLGLAPPGCHWPWGGPCRPAPGPILEQYCPGGARRCPGGHGPGLLCSRLFAGAVPRVPAPAARGRCLPGAGHHGQRRAPPAGSGVRGRSPRSAGPRLPAVPGSRTAGLRHVHPSRERPPAAGPRPGLPLPLPRRGRRGAPAPLALSRGRPRARLPSSRRGPGGAPHLRVDASEAEPAREK